MGDMEQLIGAALLLGGFWLMVRNYLESKHKETDGRLARIESELRTNGGRSLKDLTLQVRDGQNELKGRFDSHLDLHIQREMRDL